MNTTPTGLSYIIHAQNICDEASLCIVEGEKTVPFSIRRVYYISNTDPGAIRGKHAHKDTKQVLFCIKGSVTIVLDNGKQKEEVKLNSPEQGIFLDVMMWHEMKDFTPDTVLLVFASDIYREADYIRSYAEFINLTKTV